MDLGEVIISRRSIRKYSGGAISDKKIKTILEAGLLAPTGKNLQACEFYVVKNRSTLMELSEAKDTGGAFLATADAAIIVTVDEDITDTWIEDSSIALSYMSLMATDQGVGSCWVQIRLRKSADGEDSEKIVRSILKIPDHYRIVGVLSLGMPESTKKRHSIDDLLYSKVHEVCNE